MSQSDTSTAALDFLSPAARAALKINARDAYTALVPKQAGSSDARDAIDLLDPESVLSSKAAHAEDARALLSGLWLWHDFLDESHTISQGITSATGSFWHAIMHRREGDFSNSKYWYARCASYPALLTLATHADDVIRQAPADKSVFRLTASGWNPNAFVDLVESVHNKPDDPRHAIAVSLQQAEWRTLFDHCVHSARGL